jgi:hypothetical protein
MALDQTQHKIWQKLPSGRAAYADELEETGFHKVQLVNLKHWDQIHAWCTEKFGLNYTWTGSQFWFCTSEDAIEFSLTWC